MYLRIVGLLMLSSRKKKTSWPKSNQASKEFLTVKSSKSVTKPYPINPCQKTQDFQSLISKDRKIGKQN